MAPRLEKLKVEEEGFINFLKLSFGQKRKTLWNNLKTEYAANTLKGHCRCGREADSACRSLTLEKTAAIFRALVSKNGDLSGSGK